MKRIAALYDIHGNLPAREALLGELDREAPDLVVVGGDVAAGCYPVETLQRLGALNRPTLFVRGNCDRVMVEIFDGERDGEHELTDQASRRITARERDLLVAFEPTVEADVEGLGAVLFCHGTPSSDEEIVTPAASDDEVASLLSRIVPQLVVCGHTHLQFDRRIGRHRLVNAGSVGLAYGETGACWALIGPEVELRTTPYDLDAAVPRLAAAEGWEGARTWAERRRQPISREEAIVHFERMRR